MTADNNVKDMRIEELVEQTQNLEKCLQEIEQYFGTTKS
jgi:hypothetical protein